MKKVGVLGGTGFLGMNILSQLSQNKSLRLSATSRTSKPEWKLFPIEWNQLDLHNTQAVAEFLKDLDVVIYLAHEGGPNVLKDWKEESDQNLLPIRNFIEAIQSLNRPTPMKVIYFSSGGAIYGKSPDRKPWTETDELSPVSSYGVLKQTCENVLRLASLDHHCNCIVLRVANPYGNHFKHQKDQGIIDVAVSKLKSQTPFQLFGSTEFVRDFIHVDDLTAVVERCIDYDCSFEVFNVGSGEGTSIGDALEQVQKAFSQKLTIVMVAGSDKIVPIDWSVLNIEKAKNLLHWSPRISLEAGLKSLADTALTR